MNNIQFEQKGYIGILTVNREAVLNALNAETLEALGRELDALAQDCRCLIITGAGKRAFAAGADIAQMQSATPEEATQLCIHGNRVLKKLEESVPVIAAINGWALGGGCELALACDIRIAGDNAVFALPETSLGILPGFGGMRRLIRAVGDGKARELVFTGGRVNAQEALRIGLVNEVVPAEEVMDTAFARAQAIAGNAPIGVRQAKRAMQFYAGLEFEAVLACEAQAFGRCFQTVDQQNAMSAFLEKKKAQPFIGK